MADLKPIEWRIIPSIQTHEVSSDGRIRRRFTDRVKGQRGGSQWPAGKELSPHSDRKGYSVLTLTGRTYLVHRLVCEAFNGPAPFPSALVRHLDDDRTNNHPSNLAWGDMRDNIDDAKRNGRFPERKKKFCRERARALRDAGMSYAKIGQILGVSDNAVRVALVHLNQATTAHVNANSLKKLAHPRGLEPLTSAFGGQSLPGASGGKLRNSALSCGVHRANKPGDDK